MSVAGLKKQFYKASQVRRGRVIGAWAWLGGPRASGAGSPGMAGKRRPVFRLFRGTGCAHLGGSEKALEGRLEDPLPGACRQAS